MVAALEVTSSIKVSDIAHGVKFSEPARLIVPHARNPRELLNRLLQDGLAYDAARLVVRALPKPYCVAWACASIRSEIVHRPLSSADVSCLESAEEWLRGDWDESRRVAAERAAAANYESPAAWAAAAAGWSGGSLAPRGYAVVAPGPYLTSEACFAAVCLQAAFDPATSLVRLVEWIERACATFGRVPSAT